MPRISHIFIIYNPNSTGDAKKNATSFAAKLKKSSDITADIVLKETEHPGHAEDLAREYASEFSNCMIISSSGDGGFHDCINGILTSKHPTVIAGLLPSGNANDHYNAAHYGSTITRIAARDVSLQDVLRIDIKSQAAPRTRYAHSYAGIGLTPNVGKELNETQLNRFNEVWLVAKHLWQRRSVSIAVNGRHYRYESLVFSNIHRMSKVLKLAKKTSLRDGLFEINGVRRASKFRLITHLIKASTAGLDEQNQAHEYVFNCLQKLSLQVDGEIYSCAKHATVTVRAEKQRLTTII